MYITITIVSMTHPYPFIHRPLQGLDEVLVVVIHQVFSVVVPVTTSKRVMKVFTKPFTIEPSQSWNLAPGFCCKNAKWVKFFLPHISCHQFRHWPIAEGMMEKIFFKNITDQMQCHRHVERPTKCHRLLKGGGPRSPSPNRAPRLHTPQLPQLAQGINDQKSELQASITRWDLDPILSQPSV